MVTGDFNPYHQWLGLDSALTQPNYYELLGIEERETDPEKISAAADIAMSRVRSFRPGERAAWWARLLDEIAAAKKCLHDPQLRAEYDRRLPDRTGGGPGTVPHRRPAPRSKHSTPEQSGPDSSLGTPGKVPMAAPQAVPMSAPGTPPRVGRGSAPAASTPLPMTGPSVPMTGPAYPGAPASAVPLPQGVPGAYPNPGLPYGPPPQYPAAPGYPSPPVMPMPVPQQPQPPQPGSPYAYAPPTAYPGSGYGAAVPPVMPMPPSAYPPPPPGYPGAVGVPLVADTNDPYSAALSSPSPSQDKRRPPPPINVERSGISKWLAIAIGAAVLFVVVGLGILFGVLLGNSSSKNGSGTPTIANKHEKPATSPTATKAGGAKKEKKERSFKPTAAQQEAAKRGGSSDMAGSSSLPLPNAGFPASDAPPDAARGIPGIHEAPDSATGTRPRAGAGVSTGLPDARGTGAVPTVVPAETPGPDTVPQPDKPPETAPEPGMTADSKPPVAPPPQQPAGPPPTAVDAAKLATALTTARSAVLSGNYDAASRELDKAAQLPMLPDHWAKLQRLQSVSRLAKSFRSAVSEAVTSFRPAEIVLVGSSTEVSVVKASADSITVNVRGKNQTYTLEQLPTGLMLGIADSWLPKRNPNSLAAKAAYLATLKGATAEQTAQARQWFQDAAGKGADCGDLAAVLDDKYDLEKDVK